MFSSLLSLRCLLDIKHLCQVGNDEGIWSSGKGSSYMFINVLQHINGTE